MPLDSGDQLLRFGQVVFGISRRVSQPSDVKIVSPSCDLLAGEAAEAAILALIGSSALAVLLCTVSSHELGEMLCREGASLAECRHVGAQIVDPDCFRVVRNSPS